MMPGKVEVIRVDIRGDKNRLSIPPAKMAVPKTTVVPAPQAWGLVIFGCVVVIGLVAMVAIVYGRGFTGHVDKAGTIQIDVMPESK